MKSSIIKTFRKRLNDLPSSVQEQAAKAYALRMASWSPVHGVLGMLKNALDWLVDSDVFIKNFGVK